LQRAGFAQLAQDTEDGAWIGASLNSGSVELYAGRSVFRPAVWENAELFRLVQWADAGARPVYLLDDGLEMAAAVAAARRQYGLTLVGRYDIPFYHSGGGSVGGLVDLYRIETTIKQR
jgi:hypothetical protein